MGKAYLGLPGLCLAAGLLITPQAGALDLDGLSLDDQRVFGYVDGGRFQLADTNFNGEILNRMGAKWYIDKQIDAHWSVLANLHWLFWRNQATDLALFHIVGLKFDSDLQGTFTYVNEAHRARLGLYEFKYNPDAKNLGEYLLRSEAYPTIIENSQGKDLLAYAYSRVAGAEYGLNYPIFRTRGLIYAEQFNVPVNDVSLAFFAAAGPQEAEIEVGAALHRQFRFGKGTRSTNLDPQLRAYVDSTGLTTQAVKLMARGRLDFGVLAGGETGLTLYAEAALLGLKGDALYYKDVMQRLPVMMGVDVPTFGALTNLSFELEYFKNPYYGRKYSIGDATASNFSPLPNLLPEEYGAANLPANGKDDIKWSLNLHKSLNKWLDFKGRFASDHLRLLGWDTDYVGGEPMTKKTGDWYVLARIEYHN